MQGYIASNLDKAKTLALGGKALPERISRYQAFWSIVCEEYAAYLAHRHDAVSLFMAITAINKDEPVIYNFKNSATMAGFTAAGGSSGTLSVPDETIAAMYDKAIAMFSLALPSKVGQFTPMVVEMKRYHDSLDKIRERVEYRIVWLFMNIMAKLKGVEMARLVPYTWEDEADWSLLSA